MDRTQQEFRRRALPLALVLSVFTGWVVAAPPAEVPNVRLEKSGPGEVLRFPYLPDDPVTPITHYTVYRGRIGPDGVNPDFATLGQLRHVVDPDDAGPEGYTAINDTDDEGMPENYYFLVTATNADGEGSMGSGTLGPRGGIFGDPPLAAPDLYSSPWDCAPYVGEPPPPFAPPVPAGMEPPVFDYPDLCPPGMVPEPREFAGLKGAPPGEGDPPSGPSSANFSAMMMGQYWYSWAWAVPTPGFDDGGFTRMTVESPVIDRLSQTHSLAEIAHRAGAAFGDYVEVGWTVDRGVNSGSVGPALFVFRWINGVPAPVYNGAGWVQFSPTVVPGMQLPVRSLLPCGFMYWGGNWWAFVVTANGGGWIGYFPGSLWGGNFTNLTLVQWFGEVWANNTPPANDMGNGLRGTASIPPVPANFNLLTTVDTLTWSGTFYSLPAQQMTNNAYYDMLGLGTPDGFFFYGGPGK